MQRKSLQIYGFLADLNLASVKFDFEPLRQINSGRSHGSYLPL